MHVATSGDLYNIEHWGGGYFSSDSDGRLCVHSNRNPDASKVALTDILEKVKSQGVRLPMLLRFDDILAARVQELQAAFTKAMQRHRYQAPYTAVYPIKVNQQRRVVEGILAAGGENVGLEAGSKPELMAVMSLLQRRDSVIVCNGYKDAEFIRLAC